ncbi:hypothetical protein [Scopulibacillus daqui]|uniref:hypothetical protein n=1 Tax=Scopulibacillus daqui TaxID=1469162 RepID=UPI00195F3916|nr:hypothetical protein [Scopulibacillus daqui]
MDFEKSINDMAKTKNKKEISQAADDRKTYDCLMNLPQNITCQNSSDSQGAVW